MGLTKTLGQGGAIVEQPHLYFESAAMILTLITVGKMLEAKSKGKTTDALKSLLRLSPEVATVERKGVTQDLPVAEVVVGDIFLVKPGQNIPVDGIVLEGVSAVNEAALTGESIPVDKKVGDQVQAATTNASGFLRCKATRVGEDTSLAKIIRLVSDASVSKAPIAKLADKIAGIFVPAVIIIALVTILIWLLAGQDLGFALARGIAVLVISCPCALGLATPVAIMVGSGLGARHGLLFKTAQALEQTGRTKIVALDKTGTLTLGQPKVTDLYPESNHSIEDLLGCALSLESKSEHPLAFAIVNEAKSRGLMAKAVSNFKVLPGHGLSATVDGQAIQGGSQKFMEEQYSLSPKLSAKAKDLASQGKTPLFFAQNGQLLGVIAVADSLKEDSKEAVRQMQKMGLSVVMLTGDNERTAEAIARESGVDFVLAGLLPEDKEKAISMLKQEGACAMVGDGINDAPALVCADTGIAIGAGTDVAVDAASVVLVKNRLTDVPAAIRLSRATLRNIKQNLFWAFFYNLLGIPLAAGLLYPFFGLTLNPIFAAAAMSLSSFCVVSNALRLNLFNPSADTSAGKFADVQLKAAVLQAKLKAFQKEAAQNKTISLTLKVEGMMCAHCEGRVQKALEAIAGVEKACAKHEEACVYLELAHPVDLALLRKAVIDAGYECPLD